MSEYDDTHLAEPWIALQTRFDPEQGDLRNVDPSEFDEVTSSLILAVANLEQFYPERAYRFALEVVRRSNEPFVLAMVAVGPLGKVMHDDPRWTLERLREDVTREPGLRRVLFHLPDLNLPHHLDQDLSSLMRGPG